MVFEETERVLQNKSRKCLKFKPFQQKTGKESVGVCDYGRSIILYILYKEFFWKESGRKMGLTQKD